MAVDDAGESTSQSARTLAARHNAVLDTVRNNLTVSTPPPVSEDDAAAAIGRIAARRQEIDDPNAWQLTDDPLETLAYLRKFSAGVPRAVAEADVMDGLTLRLRLWWLGEEAEWWLLERARRLEIPATRIGPTLGITSRQGVHDRLRLAREKMEALTGNPPAGLLPRTNMHDRNTEEAWLAEHRAALHEIASAAVAHRQLADEEAADWLLDVARDLRTFVVTPGSLQVLRFALADLSTSPAVEALEPAHPLVSTLQRWAQLFATHPSNST